MAQSCPGVVIMQASTLHTGKKYTSTSPNLCLNCAAMKPLPWPNFAGQERIGLIRRVACAHAVGNLLSRVPDFRPSQPLPPPPYAPLPEQAGPLLRCSHHQHTTSPCLRTVRPCSHHSRHNRRPPPKQKPRGGQPRVPDTHHTEHSCWSSSPQTAGRPPSPARCPRSSSPAPAPRGSACR